MKSPKSLHSISIITSREAEDAVAELMLRETGQPATITQIRATGLSTVAVFLPSPTAPRITALRRQLRSGLATIADCGLDTRPAKLGFRKVPAEDWRESWKRHFKPLSIGKGLLVRASWHTRRPVRGQAEIVLDPGLSFGTGQHPTTEFCLREVIRLRPASGVSAGLLDVGTGSGILAIAAAKVGYQPVEAFDFDPEAVTVALRNARDNQVDKAVALREADVARLPLKPRRRFAVVCANLTADLLQIHAQRLIAQMTPDGSLVLAGILAEEFDVVRTCFEKLGLSLLREARRREWRSASFSFSDR
jgi:ribosomal protein L11 methyltransferase